MIEVEEEEGEVEGEVEQEPVEEIGFLGLAETSAVS